MIKVAVYMLAFMGLVTAPFALADGALGPILASGVATIMPLVLRKLGWM